MEDEKVADIVNMVKLIKEKALEIIHRQEQMDEVNIEQMKEEFSKLLGGEVDEELGKLISGLEKPIEFVHDKLEQFKEDELYQQGRTEDAIANWRKRIRLKKLKKIKLLKWKNDKVDAYGENYLKINSRAKLFKLKVIKEQVEEGTKQFMIPFLHKQNWLEHQVKWKIKVKFKKKFNPIEEDYSSLNKFSQFHSLVDQILLNARWSRTRWKWKTNARFRIKDLVYEIKLVVNKLHNINKESKWYKGKHKIKEPPDKKKKKLF